ncbi:hypothetical protein ABUW04_20650 [Streptacidiphilus sp. N1-10]|uniref:Transposase n=1 Tax=Streptacidiphilus jeojiensis TaxID=3229225 RepID=A0ABV6XR09_9ACTN
MRLSEWAAHNGVRYQTAWRWAKEGRIPVPVVQTPSGMWLVAEPAEQVPGKVVAYCRVVLSVSGRRLVVLEPEETTDDLVGDITDVLTSMCARLYRRRSAKNHAARAIAEDGV